MLIIKSQTNNPYFNIATEELLLKSFSENIFFIYINSPSLIVGKHQNTLNEINYNFAKDNKVPVIRRLSGGGTVYHDLGNINFCFIIKGEKGKLVDFKKHLQPIIFALEELGLNTETGKRNELLIDKLKISGNAEHVWKSRVLHHGTLLFDTDLEKLEESIRVLPDKFKSKAVKSVRSKVTNLSRYLQNTMTANSFADHVIKCLTKQKHNIENYFLSESDIAKINQLVEEKYSQWKWNFGYSPQYTLNRSFKIDNDTFNFNLKVKDGIIKSFTINCSAIPTNEIEFLCNELKGYSHNEEALNTFLLQHKDTKFTFDISKLISELF